MKICEPLRNIANFSEPCEPETSANLNREPLATLCLRTLEDRGTFTANLENLFEPLRDLGEPLRNP